MPKLRVGLLDVCLSRPLSWGFVKGHHHDLFTTSVHPSVRIGSLLAQGNLDVALLPAIDVVSTPGLRILPDLCLAMVAHGALLLHREPLEQLQQIAVDPEDRQAVALLHVILAELQLTPEIVSSRRPPETRLERHGASLLGCDDALKFQAHAASASNFHVFDLTAAWHRLTGLPCVFALWAVRDNVELPDLAFYFKSSLRYGLSLKENMARETAAELGIDSATVLEALDACRYFLPPNEVDTIRLFQQRVKASGLQSDARSLRMWPS